MVKEKTVIEQLGVNLHKFKVDVKPKRFHMKRGEDDYLVIDPQTR
jgi:hypothetical protein